MDVIFSSTCVDTLVKPSMQCPTCEEKLLESSSSSSKDKDSNGGGGGIIELKCEGTGYAARGMAEAKKFDVAFQG
jgi:hypothetical protein